MTVIQCKIDVSKIDKTKLFKGAKGTYLDCTLIETPTNPHGNSHMIVQAVSKEDRLAGVKGAILGNAKTFDNGSRSRPTHTRKPAPEKTQDDIQF